MTQNKAINHNIAEKLWQKNSIKKRIFLLKELNSSQLFNISNVEETAKADWPLLTWAAKNEIKGFLTDNEFLLQEVEE